MAGRAVLAGALVLTGCAPDPDLSELEEQLAALPGVGGAAASPQHSNFPWETQINIDLFFEADEISPEVIAQAIRDAAPLVVADPAGRHEVRFLAVEGAPEDFDDPSDVEFSNMMPLAADLLGLENSGSRMQVFQFDELRRFAEEQNDS